MKIKKFLPVSAWAEDEEFNELTQLNREIVRIENARLYEDARYYYASVWFVPVEPNEDMLADALNGEFLFFGVEFDTPFEGETWEADNE